MPTAIAAKVASRWTSPLIRKLIYPNQGFTFYPPFSSIKKHGTNATNRSKSDHHFKSFPLMFTSIPPTTIKKMNTLRPSYFMDQKAREARKRKKIK